MARIDITDEMITAAHKLNETYNLAEAIITTLNLIDKGAVDVERLNVGLEELIQDLARFANGVDPDSQKDAYKATLRTVDMMLYKLDGMQNVLRTVRELANAMSEDAKLEEK